MTTTAKTAPKAPDRPSQPANMRVIQQERREPSRLTIHRRAASALLLPGLVLVLARVTWVNALAEAAWEQAVARPGVKLLFFVVVTGLALLEWQYLAALVRLLRARGSVKKFLAREKDSRAVVRRRANRFRLGAVVLSTSLALGVVEVSFRVLQIQPPPRPPEPFDDAANVDHSLNAWGIREPWETLPQDDPRLRIVFLGDSMVFGHSVERRESFCHLVGTNLADPASGQSRDVLTINLGFPGTSPEWQLDKFLPLRDTLRPDVVVHVVYPNDLDIRPDPRLREIYRLRGRQGWSGSVLAYSYVARFAEAKIRYWLSWRKTIDYFRGGGSALEREAAWRKFKLDVRACKAAAEEGGAVYALVLFPVLIRLGDYPLMDVHRSMRTFAHELEAPYLDLLEVFAQRDADSLRVSLANEHPNALGHRLAAERITRFLEEKVFPEMRRPG